MDVNELRKRQTEERALIEKGEVITFLRSHLEPISDVEIAAHYEISVTSVRNHLKTLVDNGKVKVFDAPAQGKLSSAGLVYQWWK